MRRRRRRRYLVDGGSFQGGQRLEDAVDEGLVRIGDALLEAELRLQLRLVQQQLPVGHQLRRLAQLRRQRVHKVRHQARAAVVRLRPPIFCCFFFRPLTTRSPSSMADRSIDNVWLLGSDAQDIHHVSIIRILRWCSR